MCVLFYAFLRPAEILRDLSVFFEKAADGFLRVAGSRQNLPVPWAGQTFSADALKNPPLRDDPGGADTATTADGERQENIRENLGVWDAAGLAVGKLFPLTSGAKGCHDETHKRLGGAVFPSSQHHEVCSRCRAESDTRLRSLSVQLLTGDTEKC